MCVDIGCCADVAVTEPLLDFLQTDTICIQQAGTAMSKIVEANLFHIVVFQKNCKMLCDKVWLHQFSDRVHNNIIKVISTIAITAYLTVDGLLLSYYVQYSFKGRDEW